MNNKNILISGAGIAGLTLAYWLKKFGFNPTIVEKHPTLRTEGYKLDIRGAAVDVIKRMGLYPAIFEARTQIQQSIFVDKNGKHLLTVDPNLCGVRSDDDLEIVRGDLCRLLYDAVGEIKCLFDDCITQIDQDEQRVRVEFQQHPPSDFDLVIAADGLHSKVRSLSFGEESQFLRNLGIYVSFYSIPNFLQLDSVEIEYHFPPRFAIAYSPRNGTAKAGFAFAAKEIKEDLRCRENQEKLLHDTFADAGWEVPALLSYMKQSPDFYFDCMAQIHMPHWSKGRVGIVGDAAYAVAPVSGQGASVALVGAYVLAGELAQAQGNYQTAFARYQEVLSTYIKKNQDLAQMSVSIMEGKGPSWLQSLFLQWMLFLGRILPASCIRFFKKMGLKKTRIAANAILLKNYEH